MLCAHVFLSVGKLNFMWFSGSFLSIASFTLCSKSYFVVHVFHSTLFFSLSWFHFPNYSLNVCFYFCCVCSFCLLRVFFFCCFCCCSLYFIEFNLIKNCSIPRLFHEKITENIECDFVVHFFFLIRYRCALEKSMSFFYVTHENWRNWERNTSEINEFAHAFRLVSMFGQFHKFVKKREIFCLNRTKRKKIIKKTK